MASTQRAIAGSVALPLVQGIAAFAAGDHTAALSHFEPVEAEIHRIGGSHAQWELFEESSHMPHVEEPEAFLAAEEAFLLTVD